MRRISLDVLGRIPTTEETATYLDDSREDKQDRLIDELLAHEEMPAYWSTVLDEWFNGDILERGFGQEGFLDYLEEALRTNKPWNQIARQILLPNVMDPDQRRAAYFLAVRNRAATMRKKSTA